MAPPKSLVFITGANVGLGYYAAQQLAASGKYHVLIGSRDLGKAKTAIKTLTEDTSLKVNGADLEAVQIDVTSDASIAEAKATVEKTHGYIDILMLNAGIAQAQAAATDGSGPSLRELYHRHYDTNLFGAVVTLEAFLPLLRESKIPGGKRIAFTSSGLASLKWAGEDGLASAENYPIYRSTKTAMSMIMLGYAKSLAKEGFTVAASEPGFCATNLNNHQGFKDPRDGARVLVKAATNVHEEVHGRTVTEGEVMPW